jgi:short-subunit dehydrogenase
MMMNGKNIWLIGASEGIGTGLASLLADAGACLALSARNEQKLTSVLGSLSKGNHVNLSLDVTDLSSIKLAWEKLITLWPKIDMIIYNAGAYEPMDAQHFNLDLFEEIVNVNFRGASRILSFVLPYFLKQNRGHIVLVGSISGYRGLPASMGYGASKAALIHLAESLKADLMLTPLKVQVVNPGFVETRLTAKNTFAMPAIISPEKAADYIYKGLHSDHFEIHFPKRFSRFLKFLSVLPDPIYFWLMKRVRMKLGAGSEK